MLSDICTGPRTHQYLVVLAIGILIASLAVDARRIVVVMRRGKQRCITTRVCWLCHREECFVLSHWSRVLVRMLASVSTGLGLDVVLVVDTSRLASGCG